MKIGQDTRKVINETQEMVIAAVCDTKAASPSPKNPLVEVISSTSDDKLTWLGDSVSILRNYANAVSLAGYELHPDSISTLPEGWREFTTGLQESIKDGKSCIDVNNYKPVLRALSCLKPRLVKDSLKRDEVRGTKNQIKHLGLKQVYMLGENGFYGKPDNFQMYVRNSKAYQHEIDNLKKQQKVFNEHNMPEVSHAVKKRIKSFEEMTAEQYLGFHRIKPTDAAIILARMHGLKWHELHFLTVPFKYFESAYWTEPVERKDEDKSKDEMKRLLVMKDRRLAFIDTVAFTYQPRLYPIAKFNGIPKGVSDIISAVEVFSELNECPVFDYYWVLMPSININHPYFRHKDGWKVYARKQDAIGWSDLELKSFTNEYDAALALDTTLACDGYFSPIVLGEREGKCFFLCQWR